MSIPPSTLLRCVIFSSVFFMLIFSLLDQQTTKTALVAASCRDKESTSLPLDVEFASFVPFSCNCNPAVLVTFFLCCHPFVGVVIVMVVLHCSSRLPLLFLAFSSLL